jgi:hypothetical protein
MSYVIRNECDPQINLLRFVGKSVQCLHFGMFNDMSTFTTIINAHIKPAEQIYDITPSIMIAIATNTKSILITILVAPVPSHHRPKVIVSDR